MTLSTHNNTARIRASKENVELQSSAVDVKPV